MAFEHKYNKDDIHTRSVIAGLVNLLNNKIFFNNVLSDETVDTVQVPFYFSFTGDSRYLQEHFSHWNTCQSSQFADGNYEKIPRGIIMLSDKSIDEGALTQRFIRGTYTKEVNGKLETYSANLNPIPLTFNFEIEIITDTMTDLSKIDQIILETFYKTQIFNVNFKGFLIACTVGFPDSYTNEKDFVYSFPDDGNEFKLTFNVSLNTYYPVVDALGVIPENKKFYNDNIENLDYYSKGSEAGALYNEANDSDNPNRNIISDSLTTERASSKRMSHLAINKEELDQQSYESDIYFTKISDSDSNFPIGSPAILNSPVQFKWETRNFIHKIDILYNVEEDPTTWYYLIKGYSNRSMYDWDFHSHADFSETLKLNIVAENGYGAELYAVIDSTGVIIDTTIVKSGQNYDPNNTFIEAEHDLTDTSEEQVEAELIPIIRSGKIVDININTPGSGYTSAASTNIGFKIRSTSSINTFDVYSDVNGNQIFLELR